MSPRVARTLPEVQPILLTPRRDPFGDPAWLFEPKYDGYRGLLYISRKGCLIRSKRGNLLRRFDQLCYWVREELTVKEAILDGEVVALDSDGRQNFRDLMAGRGNLHYAAFDALWINGEGPAQAAAHLPEASPDGHCTGDHDGTLTGVFDRRAWPGSLRRGPAVGPRGDRGQAEGGSLPRWRNLGKDQEPGILPGGGARRLVLPAFTSQAMDGSTATLAARWSSVGPSAAA